MDLKAFLIIFGCSVAACGIAFFLGIAGFRRSPYYMKLLCILTGVSFFSDVVSFFLPFFKVNPNYIGNTYGLVEFALLSALYYKAINDHRYLNKFIILGIVFFLFFFSNFLFFQQAKINSYTLIFSSFVFIGLAVAYFYQLMRSLPTLQIQLLPMFWINVAVLVYFAGNLFLFILSNYLVNSLKDNLAVYWSFHNFLSIIKNVLFAIGLWQNLRVPKLL